MQESHPKFLWGGCMENLVAKTSNMQGLGTYKTKKNIRREMHFQISSYWQNVSARKREYGLETKSFELSCETRKPDSKMDAKLNSKLQL